MDYDYVDGQVLLPMAADERGGIQPVLTATANGGVAATVAPGEAVDLAVTAEVPSGWGTIVAVEWDLDGSGRFATVLDGVDGTQRAQSASFSHAFTDRGTHFAAVRVLSHRSGDTSARNDRVENLARVRVVVT
jgi:hypothetical protein